MPHMAEPMSSSEWVPADTFGARLALIRVERHWNIATAAKTCGLSGESRRQWERGTSPQRMEQVARKIADATGVSYVWLMTGGPLRSRCFSVVAYAGQLELALDATEPALVLV